MSEDSAGVTDVPGAGRSCRSGMAVDLVPLQNDLAQIQKPLRKFCKMSRGERQTVTIFPQEFLKALPRAIDATHTGARFSG